MSLGNSRGKEMSTPRPYNKKHFAVPTTLAPTFPRLFPGNKCDATGRHASSRAPRLAPCQSVQSDVLIVKQLMCDLGLFFFFCLSTKNAGLGMLPVGPLPSVLSEWFS